MLIGDIPAGQTVILVASSMDQKQKIEFPVIVRKRFENNSKAIVTDVCYYGDSPVNFSGNARLSIRVPDVSGKQRGKSSIITGVKVFKYYKTSDNEVLMILVSPKESKALEQRSAARVIVDGSVYVKPGDAKSVITGKIKNISCNGICFESEELNISPGKVFSMTIRINGVNKTYSVPATVRRLKPTADGETVYEYGCSYGEQAMLTRQIFRIMQKRVRVK